MIALVFLVSVASAAVTESHEAVKSPKETLLALSSGCDRGDGPSCFEAGELCVKIAKGQRLERCEPFYDKAAAKGEPQALFHQGERARKNGRDADALKSFIAAADKGHRRAALYAGIAYHRGLGIKKDLKRAVHFYERAADQGEADAMVLVGTMALNGEGMARDPVRAYMWLELAAERGQVKARSLRDQLDRTLTPAQRHEAQDLVAKWHQ